MLYIKSIKFVSSCLFLGMFMINNCLTNDIERTKKMSNQEVCYQNKTSGIKLSGTLTIPMQNENSANEGFANQGFKSQGFPAVILIAGYGKNDRDYTLGKHKRFLVIANHLTRKGFAVLRFDKRGVEKSTGDYATATSRDFADDVLVGIEYLKTRNDIDAKKIGLIGHSEGGMIATMVAAESKDVAFLVSMAGVIQTDVDGLITQSSKQLKADGASKELLNKDRELRIQIINILKQELNVETAQVKMQKIMDDYCEQLSEDLIKESENIPFAITKAKVNAIVNVFNSPWYRYFLGCKPVNMLMKIKIPFLAIYGSRDWIISSQPALAIISETLQTVGNTDCTTLELANLNHSFQTCETGALAEYATIEETISPEVLKVISGWILEKI